MKTELKEIIHLYLGCEIMYDRTVYTLDGITPSQVMPFDMLAILSHPHYGADEADYDEIKPILRKLEDMTEEEENVISEILGIIQVNHFVTAWQNKEPYKIDISKMVELVNTLRKMGIDMDGLIEAGSAINKATLK